LLVLLTAIGFIPLILIGAWGVKMTADHQRRELERSMLDLSRALSSAVDAELDGWVGTLRTMARTPALGSGDMRAFYDFAKEQVHMQSDWSSVVLTDANGAVVFKTVLPYGSQDGWVIDPDSLQRAMSLRQPVIGRIAHGQAAQPAFPVRVPVTDNQNNLYVLTAAIQPSRILKLVQRQRNPDGWVISVHDSSGLRVARSLDHERTIGTGPSASLAQLMQNGPMEGVGVTRTLENVEVVSAYTRLSRYGWTVAVGAPTAALTGILAQSAAVYAGAIIASLLLCTGLAVLIARRMVAAIGALQEQAVRLGRGEPVQIAPSGIYEVNMMGLALEAAAHQRTGHERERGHLLASLEQALKAQEEALARAESASRAKDDFLAVLGHELRNPLSPIVSALDLMSAREQGVYQRERDVMRRQVVHLKRLVDDLLDVSRITRGKLELVMAPVNLCQVVAQAVDAANGAKLRGPAIGVRMPESAWVMGDESRLVQVLTNLLSNAVRFGGDGAIAVTLEVVSGQARLQVRDHGVGMHPGMLEHIFEPFYQAPQPLARAAGGLGLGLAIARNIVERHGGRIGAISPGQAQGSTFEVLLPAIAAPRLGLPADGAPEHEPDAGAAHADATSSEPARRRILVVDDNQDAAKGLQALLELSGHEVVAVHSACAALDSFAAEQPEVAIVDIGLPDMNGYQLAGALRARSRGALRLIALTGYGQAADKQRAEAAGFDLHLTKPAGITELQRAIADVE
jgi:signal transduction histidine kinase/CheY-like chemotaxis protein